MTAPDRSELQKILSAGVPHEASEAAHEIRAERHGCRATFAALDHVDPSGLAEWCGICGASKDHFTSAGQVNAAATDLHIVAPVSVSGISTFVDNALGAAGKWQVATSAHHAEGAAGDASGYLASWFEAGLRVVSDGIRPRLHCSADPDAWEAFWKAAAQAGLKGNTVVLYGPDFSADAIATQIEAIESLQKNTGVFQSVAPVIYRAEMYGGVQDSLLSTGLEDMRVLAACRLGIPSVPHVRTYYDRSDLKLAHLALAAGADDVEGYMCLDERTPSEDADHTDLSLGEVSRWLGEAGFEGVLREARL